MIEPTELKTPAERLKWLITFGGPNRVKVSQNDLARALGVTPALVSYMTRGQRSITAPCVLGISAFFGVNPAWLTLGIEPVSPPPDAPSAATGSGSPSLGSVPSDTALRREIGLINLFRSVPEHKQAEILRVVSVMATYSDSILEGAQA